MIPSKRPRRSGGRLCIRQTLSIFALALATLGGVAVAEAQQLNLSWTDNSGGQAGFIIQRSTGPSGPYTQIAQTPPGSQSYTDTTVVLGQTYCYQVAAFTNGGMSAFSNLACGAPAGGFTVSVTKAGPGFGTVTSSPAGINCGATCTSSYLSGKVVTLTASPSAGSSFSGWSGGACGGTGQCTIAGNSSATVTATFAAANPVTITSVAPGQGTAGTAVPVTITGSGFATGASVSLSGSGVTAGNVNVTSATQITATLTVASSAAAGAQDLVVTNPGGGAGTLTGGFTVAASAPATLTLAYNGTLRDRVGPGNTALGPDGTPDGTMTVTLSAAGGRTVTGLRLDSTGPGTWDTSSSNPWWVLGVATSLDGPLLNASGSMAVNFPVADGGSFVLFASDHPNMEFLPGRTLTLTATFSDGSTATASTTVVAPPSAAATTLSLAYNGTLRDRVGQGNTALGADGALDGTLTVTLSASGGRTVTGLRLDSTGPGTWDTSSGSPWWVLGVAASLDGPLLNTSGSMAVNFPVADGGSFVLFASDHPNMEFIPGRTLTVTATFSDGTTATASTTVATPPPATLSLVYNGKIRDRVGGGNTALGSDGSLDGTFTATLSASGGRTITGLRLDSDAPGSWDTSSASVWWVLGVAPSFDGALLNAAGSMAVSFSVADGGTFVVFASDYLAGEFVSGRRLMLTATFSDGSTAVAVTTAP